MPSCILVLNENIASSSQSCYPEFFATNCSRCCPQKWRKHIFITISIQNGGERANLHNDLFKK